MSLSCPDAHVRQDAVGPKLGGKKFVRKAVPGTCVLHLAHGQGICVVGLVENPDTAETQPFAASAPTPAVPAPVSLPATIAMLKQDPPMPFDHTAQYRKKLKARLAAKGQGVCSM